MEIADVVIVGGGPAGLGAAIYAKRAGLSVEVYESNIYGVGQITETDRVDNYLGLWGISGWDLATNFQNHAGEMGVTPKEGTITGIRRVSAGPEAAERVQESKFIDTGNVQQDYWRTEFEDGTAVCSKTVIYAAGAKRRKLGAPGEAEFAGRGVSYCATCDGAFFRGQDVAVVGGGNAALDDALYLSGLCRRVYLIHRRNEFRGFRATVDLIRKKENIEIRTPHQVTAITGDGKVGAVCLEDGTEIPVSGVFLAVGMQPATEVLRTCEAVKLDASGYIAAGEDCATSAPGFFAAGDVRTKNLRQIITAAADGANAAMSAAAYIQGM